MLLTNRRIDSICSFISRMPWRNAQRT